MDQGNENRERGTSWGDTKRRSRMSFVSDLRNEEEEARVIERGF